MTVTIKPVDFRHAAGRHFKDAELLMANNRHANAGQLYGFAAECGIKFLLVWKGYPSDPLTGDIQKGETLRKHVNELVNNLHNQLRVELDGRGGARYLAMIPSIGHFSDWTIDQRYYTDSALPDSATKWRGAAREIIQMLDQTTVEEAAP
jgi:hypothetical protein